MASLESSIFSEITLVSFSRITGNSARGARISISPSGVLPSTKGYATYRSYCPLSLCSRFTSRIISLRCLYAFTASGPLVVSTSLSERLFPKTSPMTSASGRVIRSNAYFLLSLGWNSSLFDLLMLTSFFSSSRRVLAASASMLEPLAAVMAYFFVTSRNSSPYCSTNLCPTPTMAEKSSALVGTLWAISRRASSEQIWGVRPFVLRSSRS